MRAAHSISFQQKSVCVSFKKNIVELLSIETRYTLNDEQYNRKTLTRTAYTGNPIP